MLGSAPWSRKKMHQSLIVDAVRQCNVSICHDLVGMVPSLFDQELEHLEGGRQRGVSLIIPLDRCNAAPCSSVVRLGVSNGKSQPRLLCMLLATIPFASCLGRKTPSQQPLGQSCRLAAERLAWKLAVS